MTPRLPTEPTPSATWLLPLLLALCLPLAGCLDDPYDSRTLPYRTEIRSVPWRLYPVDLEGDGEDEYLEYRVPVPLPGADPDLILNSYVLKRHSGLLIDQLNVVGRQAGPPFLFEEQPDRPRKILIPFVRHDSLFLSVFDHEGKKLPRLFLTTGRPRFDEEDDALMPWDPVVSYITPADVTGDGKPELVVVLNTQYARLPRGVMVLSWPDGRRIGEKVVGAVVSPRVLDDIDGDGRLELISDGYAPNNGAVAGGFSDDQAYSIFFELELDGQVRVDTSWNTTGQQTATFYEDFDNDGRKSLVTVSSSTPSTARQTVIREILPHPWRSIPRKTINESFPDLFPVDLDHDGDLEMVFFKAPNELHVYDHRWQRIKVRSFAGDFRGITSGIPDLDGDGWPEFGIVHKSSGKLLLLNEDFSIKAFLPKSQMGVEVSYPFRAGLGRPTYWLQVSKTGSHVITLVPNHFWWFYRFGPPALWVLGAGLVLGIVWAFRRQVRRNRLLAALCTAYEADFPRGRALFSPTGALVRATPATRHYFDDPVPALAAFIEGLREATPYPCEQALPLGDDEAHALHVAADPVFLRGTARPYWLLTLANRSEVDPALYHAWGLMAQRIAHDLKNSLTSIQLTLQRLQIEYHECTPETASTYDGYVQRIIERIDYLRRLTRNFMKFVDLDAPELRETNLRDFLTEQVETLRHRLPTDVRLDLKPVPALPPVLLDTDQMVSVLENLTLNAHNAMPDGGLITLSAHPARGLQLPGSDARRDYVIIEVMDTGVGITAEVRRRLFEPGFSTGGSTGLGLTLVKKIIEDHGGHLEVESEPGSGAVFSLYLPLTRLSAENLLGTDGMVADGAGDANTAA